MIRQQPDMAVVGEAVDAATAYQAVHAWHPRVVVMDLHLRDDDGVEVSRRLLQEFPALHIVVLSADEDLTTIKRAFAAGVAAYVTKTDAVDELLRAIRLAVAGKKYLSGALSTRVVEEIVQVRRQEVAKPPASLLTPRDRLLLRLIAEGRADHDIAQALEIGLKSVQTYRARLLKKLRCTNVVELTRYAIREGVTPL